MSSRSQSSSRRSSSRRSSSSRGSQSKGKAIVKKTAAQNGVSFWAMLSGLVCGLTVLLLILSLFTRKEINSDILSANDNNRAEVVTRVETRDFEDFVETAKVEQLIQTLNSLREVTTFGSDERLLANIQRQQMIVDSLMQKAAVG